MASEAVARLVVYSRDYCSLCRTMVDTLHRLQAERSFLLEVVDVDDNPELEDLFGERVPVLVADGEEICHYQLDLYALDAHLSKIR
ncbi:MAG: glutaredoxin family protein [Betaproteobacteria bacterium]|nr:glutaredoxin family protein [Betaproteobacteria bacterium]